MSRAGEGQILQQAKAKFGWSPEQQRSGDLALLGDQDVEGAAGRLEIHDFEADSGRGERAGEARVGKALLRPGAEQDDLDAEVLQKSEIFSRKRVEARRVPRDYFFGENHE